ncbi:MAG: hypothetical protein IJ439_03565 [Tyzzerella sp.]|nr:hypothetical protein [Tyzzerella sp.]
MKFYYINSRNERVNFYEYPYIFQEGNLLDYEYSYTKIEGQYFNTVKNIKKGIQERNIKIAVAADARLTLAERKNLYKAAVNHLLEVVDYDVISGVNGRICTDTGYYLECQIIASNKTKWEIGAAFMYNTLKVLIPNYAWIKNEEKQFYPQTEPYALSGLDFATDFPFDFASNDAGTALWSIDHYASSHFEMIIYGPCVNPRVLINGYPYQIFTQLESNDYLIINSRDHTVTKYLANGTTANIYNSRQFTPSVFEKIPGGQLTFNWTGDFGFDLVLYVERSEPKW